ncbi:MAG: Plug domain-containing protein, partial [bacterium]|nr:Plug domain-containing protein [bacterium]
MKKFVLFAALFIFVFAQGAETEATTDTEESKQKSSSEVILTQEDFKLNNCENVGDALQTITGVFVSSTGEIGLRDVSSSKVVVILDGQRLNTAGGTGVNISSMPIENVETI